MKNLLNYDLEGLIDINKNRMDKSYQDPNTWPTYEKDFNKFKENILEWVKNGESKVLLRVYDGEFLFLKGIKKGNIGTRHCSLELSEKFIRKFYNNSLKCDTLSSHLTVLPNGKFHKLYKSVYGNKKIDYPMEFHYGIILSKWIFKHFKNQIGIIAGNEKIKVIKELIKRKRYRHYLGIDYFSDYIEVPEKYSCDNTEEVENSIKDQLKDSTSKIFLFGIGISKLAIAYKFKEFYPAVYLDAGITLSGLAGFLTKDRPYAANWLNFRLTNYDYSNVDKMDVGKNENIKWL